MKENEVVSESGNTEGDAPPLPLSRRAEQPEAVAPDGSEIRLLTDSRHGAVKSSVVEVTLPAGQVSRPVYHRTVEETWYILEGRGQVWRCPPDVDAASVPPQERVSGRHVGDPDGVAVPVRGLSERCAAVPVPHDAAVAGRGRGSASRAWRVGGAVSVAAQLQSVA